MLSVENENLKNQLNISKNSLEALSSQINKFSIDNNLLHEENSVLKEKLFNINISLNKQNESDQINNFLSNENLKLKEKVNMLEVELEQVHRISKEKQENLL